MSMNQLSIQLGKKVTKIEKWKPEQFSLGVRALGNIEQHESGLFGDMLPTSKRDLLLAQNLRLKSEIVNGWKFRIYNRQFCMELVYWGDWPTYLPVFKEAIAVFKELDLWRGQVQD